jgi:hypothetical protein
MGQVLKAELHVAVAIKSYVARLFGMLGMLVLTKSSVCATRKF